MKEKNKWMLCHSMLLFFCLSFSLSLLVCYPREVFAQNPYNAIPASIPIEDQIFRDVVLDFAIYESLLHDVSYEGTKLLPLHANSMEEAFRFLSAGFCPSLAKLITEYYFVECSPTGIQVNPMDSIPIITLENQVKSQINLITPSSACVSCRFYNCYEWGDEYLYRVFVKKQASHWIIERLSLQTVKPD